MQATIEITSSTNGLGTCVYQIRRLYPGASPTYFRSLGYHCEWVVDIYKGDCFASLDQAQETFEKASEAMRLLHLQSTWSEPTVVRKL